MDAIKRVSDKLKVEAANEEQMEMSPNRARNLNVVSLLIDLLIN